MARFNLFYYLFAVFAVLALVANAAPTSTHPNTGSVAGMPGMATEFDHDTNADADSTQHKQVSSDSESEYMNEMENALEAAAKAAAKATPTSAGPSRPTPGVPTTAPSPTGAKAQASPSASAAAAKPKGMLSSLPLVGGLMGGLPI